MERSWPREDSVFATERADVLLGAFLFGLSIALVLWLAGAVAAITMASSFLLLILALGLTAFVNGCPARRLPLLATRLALGFLGRWFSF